MATTVENIVEVHYNSRLVDKFDHNDDAEWFLDANSELLLNDLELL